MRVTVELRFLHGSRAECPPQLRRADGTVDTERIGLAVEGYFRWRREVALHSDLVPLTCFRTAGQTAYADLFSTMSGEIVNSVAGKDRDLAAQLALCYEGVREGTDALLKWRLQPVGAMCALLLVLPHDDNARQGPWTLDESRAITVELRVEERGAVALQRLSAGAREERAQQLHKLVSFVTWFESREGRGKWMPFPDDVATAQRLGQLRSQVARDMAVKIANSARALTDGKIARGFLLFGPAGTGKSSAIRECMQFFHMFSVWGETEQGAPKLGTGAALKGGLQGDLEMRLYALFMRARAAPWLPCAISIDEIDFTAPSRTQIGSQESGGNLWLQLLSDDDRPPNVTFFATTNVLANCLEQLVSRLDAVFVGLLPWADSCKVVQAAVARWGDDMFVGGRRDRPFVDDWGHQSSYYEAVLLGMTPRVVNNLTTLAEIESVQRQIAPWPTLSHGLLTYTQLMDPSSQVFAVHGDCETLRQFLWGAMCRGLLTGRIIVDVTRLRERLIIVDVEVLRSPDVVLEDTRKQRHFFSRDAQGDGQTFTRTYVLHEQDDEASVWAVFARLAYAMRATHCTYVSDAFLKSCTGGSSAQGGADERNRDAIMTAVSQYMLQCDSAVVVMPLRYARIQKAEDGGPFGGSSTIHATEVWDMLTGGWRVERQKRKLFALVAAEPWELNAIETSTSMAWHLSPYRVHLQELAEEEQLCPVCDRKYSLGAGRDLFGCNHVGRFPEDSHLPNSLCRAVVRYDGPTNNWSKASFCTPDSLTKEMGHSPEHGMRAKWSCCGKPFLERDCPNRKHSEPARWEDATPNVSDGRYHPSTTKHTRWWCNYCCAVASNPGCMWK